MAIARILLAMFFIIAGVNHFLSPAIYLQLVPENLPARLASIYISGAFEILGGLGVLVPATRRLAGAGLILLLLAVFPANIYGALYGMSFHGAEVPRWILWLRLPFQPLFIAWVYLVSWKR